jgi:hypothetical protein
MAGLFGFLMHEPRPAGWAAMRLREMAALAPRRADHRQFTDVRGPFAIGASGPGLLPGNLRAYGGARDAVFVPEGELYHADERFRSRAPADRGWAALADEWIQNGISAVAATDGLFNLVLFEPSSSDGPRVSIANDRWGSRRFYTIDTPDAFVFGSELSVLAPWVRGDLDRNFIEETICFAAPLDGRTWFRDVSLMPPATAVVASAAGVRSRRYWTWSETASPGAHARSDRLEALHQLWTRAISARLTGGPCGQQLSGGLDSRLILAEAVARVPTWPTITYGEDDSDEMRCAREAARVAGSRWHHVGLPGPDWLERRVGMSLESDGMLDIVNAHQAGHLGEYRRHMAFELSGFLGDAIVGDTGYQIDGDQAFGRLGYWPSPVSLSAAVARERVTASLGSESPSVWLLETKWRRATNGWPHAAVNDVEVRKPFMDYALVDFAAGLPSEDRRDRRIQIALLQRYGRNFLRAPWQKTGVAIDASRLARNAIRAVRVAHRQVQPLAARLGLPMKPWIRGAANVDAWFQDPAIQREMRSRLTDSRAHVLDFFDREAIAKTLAEAFDRRTIAIEVPANVYRVERYLANMRTLTRGSHARGTPESLHTVHA